MNINQVEKITGISKTNIIFYERRGLIKPKRNKENDYRNYSDQNIILNQIKLIRLLSFSIDGIASIQKTGKLINLEEHIKLLKDQIKTLSGSIKMCECLIGKNDIVKIDKNYHLSKIDSLEATGEKFNSFIEDFRGFIDYKETKEFKIFQYFVIIDEAE